MGDLGPVLEGLCSGPVGGGFAAAVWGPVRGTVWGPFGGEPFGGLFGARFGGAFGGLFWATLSGPDPLGAVSGGRLGAKKASFGGLFVGPLGGPFWGLFGAPFGGRFEDFLSGFNRETWRNSAKVVVLGLPVGLPVRFQSRNLATLVVLGFLRDFLSY